MAQLYPSKSACPEGGLLRITARLLFTSTVTQKISLRYEYPRRVRGMRPNTVTRDFLNA